MCVCLCAMCIPSTPRDQKRASGLLELELYIDGCEQLCGERGNKPGLLQKQPILLTTEKPLWLHCEV